MRSNSQFKPTLTKTNPKLRPTLPSFGLSMLFICYYEWMQESQRCRELGTGFSYTYYSAYVDMDGWMQEGRGV